MKTQRKRKYVQVTMSDQRLEILQMYQDGFNNHEIMKEKNLPYEVLKREKTVLQNAGFKI